jgi:hypothetical protein
MDWKSPVGIMLPILSFFCGFLIHYLLNRLTIYKYKKLGHDEMAELLINEKKNRSYSIKV